MRTGLSRLPADPPRPEASEAVLIAAAPQSRPTPPAEPVRPLKIVPYADSKRVIPPGSRYQAFIPRTPEERVLALGLLILAASLGLFAVYTFFTASQSPGIQTSALAPAPVRMGLAADLTQAGQHGVGNGQDSAAPTRSGGDRYPSKMSDG